MTRLVVLFVLLAAYGTFFTLQENRFTGPDQQLAYPLPSKAQKIVLGYLRQLGGEMHFIKASVFFGGIKAGRDPLEYAEPLAQHFSAAATLHPEFADTYLLCQAILPYISPEYVRYANKILVKGMAALPDNFILPFFAGFNHFYHLDEPLEAARLLHLAAKRPNAPPLLEHLANILSAEGGNIYAALIGLRGMHASEKDERIKKRYAEEIIAFEKAVTVLEAIRRYEERAGLPLAALSTLVPQYLLTIPDVGPIFKLEWKPPHLGVVRIAQKRAPH